MNDPRIAIVMNGLRHGRITEDEANMYLTSKFGTTVSDVRKQNNQEHTSAKRPIKGWIAASLGLLLLASILGLYFVGDPTGFATRSLTPFETGLGDNIVNATYLVDHNITGLRINGALHGEGNTTVYFDTNYGRLLVGTISSNDGSPRTDKASYGAGENITIENAPIDATYYLDDGTTSVPVTPPFTAPDTSSTLIIVANISGELTTYRLPIIIGDQTRITAFNNVCVDTCDINVTNGTLTVETTDGASVAFSTINIIVPNANTPPILAVAFDQLSINETTTLNLSQHFIDPDEDELLYSAGTSQYATLDVQGEILTITPEQDGTENIFVYAGDQYNITQATIALQVHMPADIVTTQTNETNSSTNDTAIPTETADTTPTNATNETNTNSTASSAIDDCTNPNPNLRPISCFAGNEEAVFEELVAPLKDKQLNVVGRMTRYGNLVIRGVLRENSAATPSDSAFSVGYTTTEDFKDTYTPTAWIDSSTGDMHLRGIAHQEQPTVLPPQYGSYIIQNSNGLVLAYIDRRSGDIYLRGDVVQLGKLQ